MRGRRGILRVSSGIERVELLFGVPVGMLVGGGGGARDGAGGERLGRSDVEAEKVSSSIAGDGELVGVGEVVKVGDGTDGTGAVTGSDVVERERLASLNSFARFSSDEGEFERLRDQKRISLLF